MKLQAFRTVTKARFRRHVDSPGDLANSQHFYKHEPISRFLEYLRGTVLFCKTSLSEYIVRTADRMPATNFTIETLWRELEFKPTPNQKDAILHIDGPLYLPAGPVSDKRGSYRSWHWLQAEWELYASPCKGLSFLDKSVQIHVFRVSLRIT
jgi:hypothetical protein